MKKVFLYAYDEQNLGDDLFIHTIVGRYPDVQFYLWSDRKNRETFACLPNLKVIDRDSGLVRALGRLRPSLVARYKGWLEQRCDAVVYIGGSIFMEYPNWQQICAWWEYEAENRPLYVMGANFGPWHTEAYRAKMAGIFKKTRDVCFRDRYSRDLFRDVPAVRWAPDILFSYPVPRVPVKEKQVFVSVIDCAERDGPQDLGGCDGRYVANMAKLLRGYLEDGYSLVLASFCKAEGDEAGIEKILATMGCKDHPDVSVLCYDGTNAGEMTAAIAGSGYVISTRFHGTILGLAAGRPVLPVVYSDKTLHVLEDLGFTGTVYDLRSEGEWAYEESRRNLAVQTEAGPLRDASQAHFAMLDNLLGKEDKKK